jgi:glucose 1-dehydrogenase
MGVFWGCSEAVRSFIDNRVAGSIVNISSIHGRAAFPGWAAYDMAKGGVDALTRYAAVEYGPLGIRVNAIAPGPFQSKMMAATLENFGDSIKASVPLHRIGEPSDMAGTAIFLSSKAGAYITGAVIPVDGGLLL